MKRHYHHITVFEYESIRVGHTYGQVEFSDRHFDALAQYHSITKGLYYDLGHKKITFKEYVGVIQVGDLMIEILPKADKAAGDEKTKEEWKRKLISMLRAVGLFDIHAPSSTSLKIKTNSILDLYFELYVSEIEYLLHLGLAKKYRKTEGNSVALKGSLLFNKHIQQNLVHQERSYVRYTTYDTQHLLHFILYKALKLLKQINTLAALQSRIGALLLHFPEMPDAKVTEATFPKLAFNRKTAHYQKATEMARLLLLNYHPDISRGGNHVLALMFDMNLLWEQFVLVSLRKGFQTHNTSASVRGQVSMHFWKSSLGNRTSIRPDIVIDSVVHGCVVLDTKWKNLGGINPSSDDLRQMYVYHHYYQTRKVAIVYPGKFDILPGHYIEPTGEKILKECCLIGLNPQGTIKEWQHEIFVRILVWLQKVDLIEH